MSTQSLSRAISIAGEIPPPYIDDSQEGTPLLEISPPPIVTVATTALASTAVTSTATIFDKKITPQTDEPANTKRDTISETILSLKFMNDVVDAIAQKKSLESFAKEKFNKDTAPQVDEHHLHVAVSNLSMDGIRFFKGFTWRPPYYMGRILYENLALECERGNHLKISKYKLFIMELIEAMGWGPEFFHTFYLTSTSTCYIGTAIVVCVYSSGKPITVKDHKDLTILAFIQKTYGFTGAMILQKLDLKEVERVDSCPYHKNFGITPNDIKQRITELKKIKKS